MNNELLYVRPGMLFYEGDLYSPESKHIILYSFGKNYGSVAVVRKLKPKVPTFLLCPLGLRSQFLDGTPLLWYNLQQAHSHFPLPSDQPLL